MRYQATVSHLVKGCLVTFVIVCCVKDLATIKKTGATVIRHYTTDTKKSRFLEDIL